MILKCLAHQNSPLIQALLAVFYWLANLIRRKEEFFVFGYAKKPNVCSSRSRRPSLWPRSTWARIRRNSTGLERRMRSEVASPRQNSATDKPLTNVIDTFWHMKHCCLVVQTSKTIMREYVDSSRALFVTGIYSGSSHYTCYLNVTLKIQSEGSTNEYPSKGFNFIHTSCLGQFYLFVFHVSWHVARYDPLGLEIFDEVLQFSEAAVTRITNPVVASTFALDWRFVWSLG